MCAEPVVSPLWLHWVSFETRFLLTQNLHCIRAREQELLLFLHHCLHWRNGPWSSQRSCGHQVPIEWSRIETCAVWSQINSMICKFGHLILNDPEKLCLDSKIHQGYHIGLDVPNPKWILKGQTYLSPRVQDLQLYKSHHTLREMKQAGRATDVQGPLHTSST